MIHWHRVARRITQTSKRVRELRRQAGVTCQVVENTRMARMKNFLKGRRLSKAGLAIVQEAVVATSAVHERLDQVCFWIVKCCCDALNAADPLLNDSVDRADFFRQRDILVKLLQRIVIVESERLHAKAPERDLGAAWRKMRLLLSRIVQET